MKKRLTRKLFCEVHKYAKKLRRNDPIQFEVLFNEWKRSRNYI